MWTRYLAVLIALIPCAGLAQVGTVSSLEGTATAIGEDQAERPLSVDSEIMLNDRVTTLASTKLEIKLMDDTVISMGELSEMVIDEYVVNPQEPTSSRGSVKLVKGLFRMITGKVTKLNPDQFRVRTRVATIGIRGCDVGYELTNDTVNVMALGFGPGESLEVRMIDPDARDASGGWDGITDGDWTIDPGLWKETLPIDRPGRMVNVNPRTGMKEGQVSPQQMRRFMSSVSKTGSQGADSTEDSDASQDESESGDSSSSDAASDEGSVTDSGEGTGGAVDESTGFGDESAMGEGGGTGGSVDEPFFDPGMDTPGGEMPYEPGEEVISSFPSSLGELEGDIVVGDDGLILDPETFQPLSDDSGSGSDSGGGGDDGADDTPPDLPPDNPPDDPPDDTPSDPVFTHFGGGTHWSWGVWGQGNVAQGVEFTGTPLPPVDVQGVINGANLYNLSGSGDSAAVIKQGSDRSLVTGSADLSLQIGASVSPTWDGIFSLGNQHGDSLDFTATGSVQPDGTLQGNQQSYQMTVGGNSYDRSSVTHEDIHGYLVGDPNAAMPVSGAVGTFQFDHGSAATVQGGFGADLH